MVDTPILNEKIKLSGLKKKYLAERLNLSHTSLNYKISGKNAFTVPEMVQLSNILGLSYAEIYEIFIKPNMSERQNVTDEDND